MIDETENLSYYAIAVGGVVTNVVVWDGETPYSPDGELVALDGLNPQPGIGWDYDGETFTDNRPIENLFDL
jgi:hypothetical protein